MSTFQRHRKFFAIASSLLLSYGCQLPPKVPTKELPNPIREREYNTVLVCTYKGCGTGLIIRSKDRSKYYMLSVLHLATRVEPGESDDNPSPIAVIDSVEINESFEDAIEARIVAYKQSADLVLYSFDPKTIEKMNGIEISDLHFDTRKIVRGDKIYSIGNPSLIEDVYSEGYVSKPYHEYKNGVLEFDVHYSDLYTNWGASGSGVFDASTGGIVGIVSMMSTDLKMCYIITTDEILQFLQESGLESEFEWK